MKAALTTYSKMEVRVKIDSLTVGDRVEVNVSKVVHGGHFLAHFGGHTIFVRGALTGEMAEIQITSKRNKVYFADAISIQSPSPYRVTPPCESSRTCGGCDFQFIDLAHQRDLKNQVLRESMRKFSGLDEQSIDKLVGRGLLPMPLSGQAGTNWRLRSRFVWSGDGWHMRRHASHVLVPTPDCRIISQRMRDSMRVLTALPDGEYHVVEGENGVCIGNADLNVAKQHSAEQHPAKQHISGPTSVQHSAFGAQWMLPPDAFWQADPHLVEEIAIFFDQTRVVNEGDVWWDLYGGAGVFSAYLSNVVGPTGAVMSVDADLSASRAAREALSDRANIEIRHRNVDDFLDQVSGLTIRSPQGVLLDPPRAGVGESVSRKIMAFKPLSIIYIACDPVALARDMRTFLDDYRVVKLRAWDAFPMSHHFETVVLLQLNLS